MKYKLLCVGKIKESFYRDEISSICSNIKKYGDELIIIEIPDIRIPDNLSDDKIERFLEKECEPMERKIEKTDYVVALCIEGKEITTDKHKELIKRQRDENKSAITYIIGGSLGLPQWVKKRADYKLSFSKMTFPHQLMRMVLCEELMKISADH